MSNRRLWTCLGVVLAVAFATRLAAGFWWQSRLPPGKFEFGDSDSYWELARTIARGENYAYGPERFRVFRTPGYPLFLAPLHLLSGGNPPIAWGRAWSAALGTISVGGLFWLGRKHFSPSVGLLAAAVAAVEPGSVSMGVFVLSEAAFCPLMLLHLGLCAASWQASSWKASACLALAAGMSAGAATLVRPSWLLFAPLAAAVGVAADRRRARQTAIGMVMLAGLVLAMVPWWIRNWRVTGRFVPTTLQVGASLYDGLSPMADGSSNMSFVPDFVRAERVAKDEGEKRGDTFEYRLDRRLRDASLAWAKTHPERVAELAIVKFLRIWNIWPNERGFSSWPLRLAVIAGYLPVLLLGLVGAWRYSRRGWPYVLLWLPAPYFTALHVIFVGSIRYRLPAMLAATVLAAAAALRPPGRQGHHLQ